MKKICLLFSMFLFLGAAVNAQPWIQNLKNQGIENPNFNQIRDAFYQYKQSHPEMVRGEKQFKRWEYFWEKRVDENGNFPSQELLVREWNKAQLRNNSIAKKTSEAGVWEILGPKDAVPSGGGGVGRINCIAFDPIDPTIIYAGSPAGGLWRSDDDGLTWFTTTDNLPCIGVSDIVINPENRNEIYIATGDRDAGDTRSLGVFKSTDGGANWVSTGLEFAYSTNIQITKMIMHKNDPDTIVATTDKGIYRTFDGGDSWTKIVTSGEYFDLEAKPGDPNTLYASTGSSVIKTTDFFTNRTTISTGVSFGSTRLMLAVTPANANVIYTVGADGGGGFAALHKSSDGGATWVQKSTSPNILGWSTSGTGDTDGQGWYDLGLGVSETDENNVYVGGINIWRSTNGGTSWSLNAHWYGGGGAEYVHADIHYLIFKPGSGTVLYSGNDGGVFKTQNNGTIWNDISAGLQVQQIYKMSTSQDVDSYVIGGAQDNGTNLFSRLDGVSSMEHVLGGDGMDCAIDPSDYRNMYGASQYGDINRSTDGGASFDHIKPSQETADGPWVTPYVLDPSTPTNIWIGYRKIYKSEDMGETWIDKSSSQPIALGINGSEFDNIKVAHSDGSYVLAATSSRIFKTDDGGFSWTNITTGITSASTLGISGITFHENSVDTIWATLGGYSETNKVFKSVDGGTTWINITNIGLPNVPVNCVVHQRNSALEDVYIGTDLGVYYLNSEFGEWQPYNTGLPNTIVTDLEIQYKKSLLRASTYGRGLWEVSTLNPTKESTVSIKELSKSNNSKIFTVYPNPSSGDVNLIIDAEKGVNKAHIYVKNITGQTVKVVYDANFDNGKATLNLKELPKGVYTVTVRSEKLVTTTKLTLVN
ncbi:MAG: T9SS type A sorting domain-containing protein [Bacteroidota bacterium]